MIEYTVMVYANGSKFWYLNGSDDEAEAVFSDRWDDFHDAQDAYFAELLKKQEENE